jgi:acyl-CoA-binding protein
MQSEIDKEFKIAFEKISCLKEAVAPDIMLKLYAFNKQASFGNNFSFNSGLNVRSAFKFNAWMQLKDMTPEQAKKEYIKLANTIINPKK